MAYVVARPNGRFEVRESLHTPKGPRARTLAGFQILTDEVLARAARRATRPFDAGAVLASGARAGARVTAVVGAVGDAGGPYGRFVEASQRMARSLGRASPSAPADPGAALIDLLGFVDTVTASQPARPSEPLAFPALAGLVGDRRATASAL
jgi:hypothetical protein